MNTPRSRPDGTQHYRSDTPKITDDNAGFLIKLVYLSLNRALDQEMAQLELTAIQWRPIAMLYQGRAETSAELARLNGVDTGAMTRTLDRLEAKGLVQRTRSLEDRRVVRIMLTDSGREKARHIPSYIAKVLNQHLRGFSADEVAQLKHLLQRMLANGSLPCGPGRT